VLHEVGEHQVLATQVSLLAQSFDVLHGKVTGFFSAHTLPLVPTAGWQVVSL
jgi:hypothetical protein